MKPHKEIIEKMKKCENCDCYTYCDDNNIQPNGRQGFCSYWEKELIR